MLSPSQFVSFLPVPFLHCWWGGCSHEYRGPIPWDEGRLLQELPRAHRGNLVPWCSAELLKRLGSKLVVKQEKKKIPNILLSTKQLLLHFMGVIL